MTLRLRLVIGLVVLLTVGLALFGFATYGFYQHSEYQRLDSQVRSLEPVVDRELDVAAGFGDSGGGGAPGGGGPGGPGGGGPPPVSAALGTYAELRSPSGALLATINYTSTTPKLPSTYPALRAGGALFTVGSSSGSGQFRCLVVATPNGTSLIAIPTTEVTKSLHKLALIEAGAAAALLLVLSGRLMADPAPRAAAARAHGRHRPLDQRRRPVPAGQPTGGPTEVGELGLALNTMLDDIEDAFKEREATERRLRQFLADAVPRAADPAHVDPGIRRAVPPQRRERAGRPAHDPAAHRGGIGAHGGARRGSPAAGPARSAARRRARARRSGGARRRRMQRRRRPRARPTGHPRRAGAGRGLRRPGPPPPGDRQPRHQRHRGTPRPGTAIEVSARLEDGRAVVSVRDHGGGLDAEALAHVFDRFWQADRARSAPAPASVSPSSRASPPSTADRPTAANADGGGAVFTLRLPIDRAARHAPRCGRARRIPGGLEGLPRPL